MMYFDACDVGGLESVRQDVCDTRKSSSTTSQQVNFSSDNDDDDVCCLALPAVESPASPLTADTGSTLTSTSPSPTEIVELPLLTVTASVESPASPLTADTGSTLTSTSPSPTEVVELPLLTSTPSVESPASPLTADTGRTQTSPSPSKVVKLPLLPLTRRLFEIGMISQQVSFNTNNNDPVESPASCADGTQTSTSPSQSKVVKMLLLPLTRRLPKFGKRSSPVRDKDSPSTSTMAVDDPHVQTQQNDDQKTKDLEDRKDTYQEGNYCGRNQKKSTLPFN